MATLDRIASQTSALRQLFMVRKIEQQTITREELEAHLREDFEEDREDIEDLQELYITLGVLQPGTDLFEMYIDLYNEVVVGFFDTEEEKLYVVQDGPEFRASDMLTYAHEFTHGLQQQHFDIHATSEALESNSDKLYAFQALVEGDATLSEGLYMLQHLTQAQQAEVMQESENLSMENFQAAPHILRRTIVFPYQEGSQFVFGLYLQANGWSGINAAFKEVPESTEQVLHPEKYISGEDPTPVQLPDLVGVLGAGWSLVRQDTLGELLLLAYLESVLEPEKASQAAEGWGGDAYSLFQGPDSRTVLASQIAWDTEEDAHEFFDTFMEFTSTRTRAQWQQVGDTPTSQAMVLPNQSIYVDVNGLQTRLVFAPDFQTMEQVRNALGVQ